MWVRRPVGEAANPAYSVAHKPHPVAIPAWGCFSAHGPGYMAMFEGSLDAAGLRDIFRDYLLPTVAEHFGEGADGGCLGKPTSHALIQLARVPILSSSVPLLWATMSCRTP